MNNHALTPQETEVLDDIADLVREDRRKRFEFKNSTKRGAGTAGWHRSNIRQLRRIARDPHYALLRPIYLELSALGEDLVDKIEDAENGNTVTSV